jgi:hypothetical protein
MTMMSNFIEIESSAIFGLLADAEALEDVTQDILAGAGADDLIESAARRLQVDEDEFFWRISAQCRIVRRRKVRARLDKQAQVTGIRNRSRIA